MLCIMFTMVAHATLHYILHNFNLYVYTLYIMLMTVWWHIHVHVYVKSCYVILYYDIYNYEHFCAIWHISVERYFQWLILQFNQKRQSQYGNVVEFSRWPVIVIVLCAFETVTVLRAHVLRRLSYRFQRKREEKRQTLLSLLLLSPSLSMNIRFNNSHGAAAARLTGRSRVSWNSYYPLELNNSPPRGQRFPSRPSAGDSNFALASPRYATSNDSLQRCRSPVDRRPGARRDDTFTHTHTRDSWRDYLNINYFVQRFVGPPPPWLVHFLPTTTTTTTTCVGRVAHEPNRLYAPPTKAKPRLIRVFWWINISTAERESFLVCRRARKKSFALYVKCGSWLAWVFFFFAGRTGL